MSIIIEWVEHDLINVNQKPVHRDMCGNWVAQYQMSMEESKAFDEFRQSLERFPKIQKAEYRL